jgi:hypothetical protein
VITLRHIVRRGTITFNISQNSTRDYDETLIFDRPIMQFDRRAARIRSAFYAGRRRWWRYLADLVAGWDADSRPQHGGPDGWHLVV